MADWSTPRRGDPSSDFLDSLTDRDVDAATLFVSAPSNQPTGSIRYLRASNKFQEWDGAALPGKVISLAWGGTGAATAAAARTSLGLGTMATQNSNAVNITAGTVKADLTDSTNYDGLDLIGGPIPTAVLGSGVASSTKFLRGDQSWQVPPFDIPYGADQSADFTAAVNTAYNLSGTHTVSLPTVVGNGGKIIILIMKGTGTWTIDPNGTEAILGGTTLTFNYGQYSALVLKADANGGKWDII